MSDASFDGAVATLADYEAFVAAWPDHERWELIVGNIFGPLRSALACAPCRAVAGGLRVQRADDRGEDFAAIPDIVALCGERPNRTFTTEADAVVEVLSRSTLHRDRGIRFDVYRGPPTLKHIVLVYRSQMCVEHVRRTAEGWIPTVPTRPADRLDLDAVFLDVPVLRPVEAAGAEEDEPPLPIP